MNFVPGVVAATAYERGEVSPHGGQRTRAEEEALNATPEMYNRVLKQMKEEVEEDIEKDEKKLKKEGKKIAHLQEKLDKEERKYIDMKDDLCEGEEVETALEYEKLRKAEKELKKLQKGHDDSPVMEKVEEFMDEVKGGAKKVLGNVAEFAHLMFADEREIKLRERAIERGDVIDGENAEY
uniref:Uncharacterized protein n=1 Tax=Plectus sambesii TaxID=2011161 RepID=A0A914WNB0_9BILA